ncbi:MAG: DUF2442 domain-containing protein [Candidatus Promineofilum sp.]|nr:DUF2442 domain-containing protein [Promineifilum sp.]MCW5864425.1 DUF2442 domain-containing protein [Anaerolineae bacterium]
MSTSQGNIAELVTVIGVEFEDDILHVQLSDGRRVSLPLDAVSWLKWLTSATDEQRAAWSIEPGGYAIYWDDLDDGIEVEHLLGLHALS